MIFRDDELSYALGRERRRRLRLRRAISGRPGTMGLGRLGFVTFFLGCRKRRPSAQLAILTG